MTFAACSEIDHIRERWMAIIAICKRIVFQKTLFHVRVPPTLYFQMDNGGMIVDSTELDGIGFKGDAFELSCAMVFENSFLMQPGDEILSTQGDQTLGTIVIWIILFQY